MEIASGIAGDYLTNINGYTGICVHNANDLANFLNINSGEIGVYLNSTKVASYGATSASLGKGSSSASIGLCGDTFHLTGRAYDTSGMSAGVLCLDNDSTSSNKVMSVSTLTQSQEASWFSASSTIPNQNFADITLSRNSSMGTVSIMARKASGKLSAINMLPTEIHLLPAGTVSGNSVTASGIILTASKCECSPDFLSYGKVGTVYGYDNPVSTSINVHITENGYLYRTTASSRKIKKEISDIIEDDLDPDRLYDLPVRQFKYRKNRLSEDDMRYEAFMPGFIAEEVAEVYPIAADLDSKGEPEDWNVRCILPPMLALIQRQKREIADLNARVEVIEGRKAC